MASTFRLEVGPQGLATLTFDSPDRKVNVFDRGVLAELEARIQELASREDIRCLVLLSAKAGNFIAGADVDEIARVTDPVEAEAASRLGQRLFSAWEALPFPTVAAIQGSCLGGGTEIALASTYRVVSDGPAVRIGLPEVRLGIIPGWGGCVRLPRRIGIAKALELILSGKTVSGRRAFRLGLADALLPEAGFLHRVREFARQAAAGEVEEKNGFDLKDLLLEKNPVGRAILFDQARKKTLAESGGHYPAPLRAIEVVKTGVEEGEEAGFDAEARAVRDLAIGPVAKNLIHVFRLTEQAKKDTGIPGGDPRPVSHVGILGAGVMGGGIAQLIAYEADIPVRLKDIEPGALAQGMGRAAELFQHLVERKRLSEAEARRRLQLIRPTLDYSGFRRVDLVIEAVVERLEVKQKVFAEMAGEAPPEAILATNTSSLPIDEIGDKTPDPGRVVGMHFFNPVHRMPLVEVVVGPRTSPVAVNTVTAFARRLGKTPIRVKDGPGFLVNRLLMFYAVESLWLLREGYAIEDLDRTMTEWGMPMGPFALNDEVGLDVASKVAQILREAFGDRLSVPEGLEALVEEGRLGKKAGKGFYRYDGKKRKDPDPEIYRLLGLKGPKEQADAGYLCDRMILPMVNEAARCLAEGVVGSPQELDLALILGTGFPPFRGGLCRWADQQGLQELVATLQRFADTVGDRYRPSEALLERAEAGGFYRHQGSVP